MRSYPLKGVPMLVGTDGKLTVKINPSYEGLAETEEMLQETTNSGKRKLLALEFCWLPAAVVEAYNSAPTETARRNILVGRVYGNCRLNCKGCYTKKDDLLKGHDLVHPNRMMSLIEESVRKLGTKSVKYLGPSEFFRDKDIFTYLDRFEKLGVILGIFVKDPMFGDDVEVESLFGSQGIHSSEELIERISSYRCLRILYNFRSFDHSITNDLVRGGYSGKEDYSGDYKTVQDRALRLFYRHFAEKEFAEGRAARLVIVNAPITEQTIGEAYDIFSYFVDRGLTVISTASMQSGCGGELYAEVDTDFMQKLAAYYACVLAHSVRRGLITREHVKRYGPSPYAGIGHCFHLCNGLLIRETGQLLRCAGADHAEWQDDIAPEELLEHGISWAWPQTKNYAEPVKMNVGCKAKPRIFTGDFTAKVMALFHDLE